MRLRWTVCKRAGTVRDGVLLRARSFGLRFGYWPCLRAPFVELAFNYGKYSLWYGLPGYK